MLYKAACECNKKSRFFFCSPITIFSYFIEFAFVQIYMEIYIL